jgi:hypothetical protein
VFAWLVDIATVVAGVAAVVALWMSRTALRDAAATAADLAESRRLAEAAHSREKAERAARVLAVADLLRSDLQCHWQPSLVHQKSHPTAGEVDAMLRVLRTELDLSRNLQAQASSVDLRTVQMAYLMHRQLNMVAHYLAQADTRATQWSDTNQERREKFTAKWIDERHRLLGLTVEMVRLIERMERHFPAEVRLLEGRDGRQWMESLSRELETDREEEIGRVIKDMA